MSETFRRGHIVWRELMTPDAPASQAFYQGLVGWKYESMPMPGGGEYLMYGDAQGMLGGVVQMTAEMGGHPPHWMPYVSVEDVAACVARAKAAGGTIGVGPMDIGPGVFAVIGDPQGAWITAWSGKGGDGEARDMATMGPGGFCWDTLNTSDPKAAAAFYGEVFGWQVGDFQGNTTLLANDMAIADVQPAPPGVPAFWLCHLVVAELDEAVATTVGQGGAQLMPPMDVPTVGQFSVVRDPQGAVVSLFVPQFG
ncbi:MAG: VOC family protein [Myxococcales bacterium]|nr:VOC family protein [Myxococcales bacterium]MCB9526089.1 VOC family protein [Myxococcales bacterium]